MILHAYSASQSISPAPPTFDFLIDEPAGPLRPPGVLVNNAGITPPLTAHQTTRRCCRQGDGRGLARSAAELTAWGGCPAARVHRQIICIGSDGPAGMPVPAAPPTASRQSALTQFFRSTAPGTGQRRAIHVLMADPSFLRYAIEKQPWARMGNVPASPSMVGALAQAAQWRAELIDTSLQQRKTLDTCTSRYHLRRAALA